MGENSETLLRKLSTDGVQRGFFKKNFQKA